MNLLSVSDLFQGEMLKILDRESNAILHVYDTDNLEGDAFVVGSDKMEIIDYDWASEDHIVMTFRQKTTDRVRGREQDVYKYQIAILNIPKKKFDGFDAARPVFENRLAAKPGKIIISEQPGLEQDLSLAEAFRPRPGSRSLSHLPGSSHPHMGTCDRTRMIGRSLHQPARETSETTNVSDYR